MSQSVTETPDPVTRALGPVIDRIIQGDIYLAGVDDLIASDVGVTVRESAGLPGWVGVVDADLTDYADFKLELRLPGESAPCGVLLVAGEVLGRTLVRGAGPTPGAAREPRPRPRVTPTPPELGRPRQQDS
jgi:hypothetical protein